MTFKYDRYYNPATRMFTWRTYVVDDCGRIIRTAPEFMIGEEAPWMATFETLSRTMTKAAEEEIASIKLSMKNTLEQLKDELTS